MAIDFAYFILPGQWNTPRTLQSYVGSLLGPNPVNNGSDAWCGAQRGDALLRGYSCSVHSPLSDIGNMKLDPLLLPLRAG